MTEPIIYHVFSKSIAGYTIFNYDSEYLRMIEIIRYYRMKNPPVKYSTFKERQNNHWKHFNYMDNATNCSHNSMLVRIIAYCIMSTHLHFALESLEEGSISHFMRKLLNSYTRYFNIRHKRKGPLWEGKYKKVLVESEEQLLYLTRYIHLNPVTAYLIKNPNQWAYSSYNEYITKCASTLCDYKDYIDVDRKSYSNFVNDQIGYQKELALIKNLMLD